MRRAICLFVFGVEANFQIANSERSFLPIDPLTLNGVVAWNRIKFLAITPTCGFCELKVAEEEIKVGRLYRISPNGGEGFPTTSSGCGETSPAESDWRFFRESDTRSLYCTALVCANAILVLL